MMLLKLVEITESQLRQWVIMQHASNLSTSDSINSAGIGVTATMPITVASTARVSSEAAHILTAVMR